MTAISQSFRCFDEVARRGSVRKAAETLHLTAAAVNQQILKLEIMVGVPLFDRLPRGMQLTLAGEIMIAAVRRSQRDFDNALSQVEDLRAKRRGHVNIGVPHSTAEHLLPLVISRLLLTHPGITFNVKTGNGAQLLNWVAGGDIDAAFCLRRSPPPGVAETRSFAQHLGVVMASGHNLARTGRKLYLRDCLNYPLVMMSTDTDLRVLLERIDGRRLHQGRPWVETSSVAMVRGLVATTHAVGFLIPENVAQDLQSGSLHWIGLADAGARLHSCLYQRAGHTLPLATSLLTAALEAEINLMNQRLAMPD